MVSKERFFKVNSIIFFEGDSPGPIYLIHEGSVLLIKRDLDITYKAGRGDLIGVPSAIAQIPRLYTARVVEEVTAIEIPILNFKNFIKGNIPIALKIVQKMCAEIRDLNRILAEPIVRIESEKGMLDIGDYFYDKNQVKQALYVYEIYLETYPGVEDYEDIAFKLAGLYEKSGNKERACELYKNLRDRFAPDSMKWEAYNKLARTIEPFADETAVKKDTSSLLAEVFESIGGKHVDKESPQKEGGDKDNILGFLLQEQEKSKE
ncbi:MAG: Crp/Fnr family transcriptional regulator [Candidatus Hydrogenedentota bacterium]